MSETQATCVIDVLHTLPRKQRSVLHEPGVSAHEVVPIESLLQRLLSGNMTDGSSRVSINADAERENEPSSKHRQRRLVSVVLWDPIVARTMRTKESSRDQLSRYKDWSAPASSMGQGRMLCEALRGADRRWAVIGIFRRMTGKRQREA